MRISDWSSDVCSSDLAEGADMLDIGGESTRPGASPVAAQDELARILPVIEALRHLDIPLSVDTSKPEVMRCALDAGAAMINDVYAFRQPGALRAVARSEEHPSELQSLMRHSNA